MKKLMLLLIVSVVVTTGCGKKNDVPKVSDDKGGVTKTRPSVPAGPVNPAMFGTISLDGQWNTPCMNASKQTVYNLAYIGRVFVENGYWYEEWNSYSDQDCKNIVENETYFSAMFQYSIGADVSTGVKEFNYSWERKDKDKTTANEYNIMSATQDTLKFYPLHVGSDGALNGSTPALRFKQFIAPDLGYEEVYTRVK